MSSSSRTSTHKIWIRRGAEEPWCWPVKDVATISEHSRKLVGRTELKPDCEASFDGLRAIICTIPPDYSIQGIGRAPNLSANALDHGFSQLLDLGIACWNYECSIDPSFWSFANQVREKWAEDEVELKRGIYRRQRSIDWMFLAVVFEWPKIFKIMSEHVVMWYSRGRRASSKKHCLPADFRAEVSKARKKYVLETYEFVRNDAWPKSYGRKNVTLSNPDRIHNRIYDHFNSPRLRIDLCKTPEEIDQNLHKKIDPRSLLKELEDSLYEPVVEEETFDDPEPRPPSTGSIKSPVLKTGRGGHFRSWVASGARTVIHSGGSVLQNAVKKHNRTPPILEPIESDASWESILDPLKFRINDHKRNVQDINYAGSEFSKLRNKRIQLSASELSGASSH